MSDGVDGLDGLSAYEIAVAHGFIGSEAAWLASLQGPRGEDGAPGASVDHDAVRSMVAEAVAQLPLLQGPRGDPGPQGERGEPGNAGELRIGGGPAVRPWRMQVIRDAGTGLIAAVQLGPTGERPVVEMEPRRDADGFVTSVDMRPFEGARP